MIDESDNCFSSRLDLDLFDPNYLRDTTFDAIVGLDCTVKREFKFSPGGSDRDHVALANNRHFLKNV
jgi:hypothetical protein